MSKSRLDTVAALMAADRIRWTVEPVVCDQCEDTCWTLEGIASGDLGSNRWETTVAWAAHQPLSTIMAAMLRTVGSQASQVRAREVAVILRETQPQLW